MVVTLNPNAGFLQLVRNFSAKVLQGVERREWDIAFFVANVIAEIGIAVLAIRVPDRFRIVYGEPGGMPFVLEAHVVEDKELGFRTEIDRIGDARGLQIILSPMANAAWVKPVAFSGDRINDI